MAQSSACSRLNCSKHAVTSLEEQNFCFDHFCTRSYELLERIDGGTPRSRAMNVAEAIVRLDECAQRSLEISLSKKELNNLDRARLLDILLWSGDLSAALRRMRSSTAKESAEQIAQSVLHEAVRGGRVY